MQDYLLCGGLGYKVNKGFKALGGPIQVKDDMGDVNE